MHFYCFSVEPLPDHPNFFDIQAAWAFAFFRDDVDEGEQIARKYLDHHKWKINSLQDARILPPERFDLLPPETQEGLRLDQLHVEIHGYETGGGAEIAPELSWMREDRERQQGDE